MSVDGCSHLSKAKWPNLLEISLSKDNNYLADNKIDAEGCLHLSKAHWPNLQMISLCKNILII